MNEKPRGRGADLTLVEEDAPCSVKCRGVEVGTIGKDDLGGFAAELKAYPLEVALSGILHEETADCARAGERDHVDAHVQGERLAGRRAKARDYIEHTHRQACFKRQLPELERGQRRLLGWLEHHRVAHGKRRRDLPQRHKDREIPRHDGANYAERLVDGKGETVARLWPDLAIDPVERLGVVRQRADRLRNVDVERILDRLADIKALEHGKPLGIALDKLGKRKENALLLAVMKASPTSVLEGAPRRGYSLIDIGDIALGDLIDHRAVARRYIVEGAAGDACLKAPVDHRPVRQINRPGDILEMRKRRHGSLTRTCVPRNARASSMASGASLMLVCLSQPGRSGGTAMS